MEMEMEMDDRLSDLPEHVVLHVISFLPTKFAAQTSLLSRRFRRLWESSPAIELDIRAFRDLGCSHLVDLANRTILHRDPPSPLHRLYLNLLSYFYYDETLLTPAYISSLLLKAVSLGLRHLTVVLVWDMHATLSPLLFSLSSLHSLTLSGFAKEPVPLCPITLTHLKSLSMTMSGLRNHFLNRITSHLNALEHLHLRYMGCITRFHLKSVTIRRLELVLGCKNFKIYAPSLEFFQLESGLLKNICWEMPLLKKAIIRLKLVSASNVPAVCEMIKALAHLKDLHLDIEESKDVEYPFHALLVSGVDLPTYFTLKHFQLEVCFHEYNIEDLVTLLEHFPALESLNLVHKPPVCCRKNKKKKLWRSKLPRNAEGNYRHAHFKDLHIDGKRRKVIEQLIRKQFSKKLKA